METVILTGASRGIGRALARALGMTAELHAVVRDPAALASLGPHQAYSADLASLEDAGRAGRELAARVGHGATLIHCAGCWPSRLEQVEGHERAWLVNCAAPLELQRPLLAGGHLRRVLVIGAGLMIKGRVDAERTPSGADFHWMRTYASTKLAFAVAMREVARAHPELDVAVMHPGVVRTDLPARPGAVGWLLRQVKRKWEAPEVCAARLMRMLARERWSTPGEAQWFFEEEAQPWPEVANEALPAVRRALPQNL
jgi:NAD(P)-dependent dehydrogenase (short-subunit alcohol dehydrogenase family)